MKNAFQETVVVWSGRAACFVIDSMVMAAAYLFAFLLRLNFQEPWWGWAGVTTSFITVWVVQWLAFFAFRCDRLLWRYISVRDVPRFMGVVASASLVLIGLRVWFPSSHGFRPPFGIIIINGILVFGGLLLVRIFWRMLQDGEPGGAMAGGGRTKRVLLVGAGTAGNLVARELHQYPKQKVHVIGFLDDDPAKQQARIQGHAVLGKIDDLPEVAKRRDVDEVIVSMIRVPRSVIRRVVQLCEEAHCPVRILPAYHELIDGSVTVSRLREIDVADLLGREETTLDERAVVELFGQKRVLVTGAGGTIGSELARQILRTGPAQLLLVERSENALYEIDREIRKSGHESSVVALLADINDRLRMREILSLYKPQIVIHAAAHKHVPMMELNPLEALRNNVLATRVLGEMAVEHGVERFVFISTDKAVKPVSVMGISKRLAEIALQDLNRHHRTRFSAVRFGNVLDSSGSVVPLFREQIRKGEAVTVTHPEMTRYFMTISEAVSLVLQAAALAQGGEIFVLDMGEPVRIVDLAEEMIALSGLRPYEDMPIVFTGIRPGEKLFEELDISERSAYKTGHARIFVSKSRDIEACEVTSMLAECDALCKQCLSVEEARAAIRRVISDESLTSAG